MAISLDALRSGQADFGEVDDPAGRPLGPVHPGEILKDWIREDSLTATALARALRVPHNRITGILAGTRAVSAETALRLARYFSTSVDLWVGLQADYDRQVAERDHGDRVAREVAPRAA